MIIAPGFTAIINLPHPFSIVLDRFWFPIKDLAGLKMEDTVWVSHLNVRLAPGFTFSIQDMVLILNQDLCIPSLESRLMHTES